MSCLRLLFTNIWIFAQFLQKALLMSKVQYMTNLIVKPSVSFNRPCFICDVIGRANIWHGQDRFKPTRTRESCPSCPFCSRTITNGRPKVQPLTFSISGTIQAEPLLFNTHTLMVCFVTEQIDLKRLWKGDLHFNYADKITCKGWVSFGLQ